MKNLIVTICLTIAVLLGSAGTSFALPPCEGKNTSSWDNCSGRSILPEGAANAGDHYEGTWVSGKPHGKGKLTGKSHSLKPSERRRPSRFMLVRTGMVYRGDFQNGVAHGHGTLIFGDVFSPKGKGIRYVGQFKNDEMHGYGDLIHPKIRYIGQFQNGNFHGEGITPYAPSIRQGHREGIWIKGKFSREQKVTQKVIKWCDVDLHEYEETHNGRWVSVVNALSAESGFRTEPDYAAVMKNACLTATARWEKGDAASLAMNELGEMYFWGKGVDQDQSAGVKWWVLSARDSKERRPSRDAQYMLGLAYSNGWGVEKDINLAKKYYQLAINNGVSKARENKAKKQLARLSGDKYFDVSNVFKQYYLNDIVLKKCVGSSVISKENHTDFRKRLNRLFAYILKMPENNVPLKDQDKVKDTAYDAAQKDYRTNSDYMPWIMLEMAANFGGEISNYEHKSTIRQGCRDLLGQANMLINAQLKIVDKGKTSKKKRDF